MDITVQKNSGDVTALHFPVPGGTQVSLFNTTNDKTTSISSGDYVPLIVEKVYHDEAGWWYSRTAQVKYPTTPEVHEVEDEKTHETQKRLVEESVFTRTPPYELGPVLFVKSQEMDAVAMIAADGAVIFDVMEGIDND